MEDKFQLLQILSLFVCVWTSKCDCHIRTLHSVLTPTVSRKLTGLRSRTMALGSDESGSEPISMMAMSFSGSTSCTGGDITQCKETHERLRKVKFCALNNESQSKVIAEPGIQMTIKVQGGMLEYFFFFNQTATTNVHMPLTFKEGYTQQILKSPLGKHSL